jgi:hypothetical protein
MRACRDERGMIPFLIALVLAPLPVAAVFAPLVVFARRGRDG